MAQGITNKRTSIVLTALAAGFACFFAFGLSQASTASAQLPICQQYPDDDICIGPTDEAEDAGDQGPGAGGQNGDNNGSGDADGSLPFTGYPLSALVLLLVALLAAGLGVRAYIAVRDRLSGGRNAT